MKDSPEIAAAMIAALKMRRFVRGLKLQKRSCGSCITTSN